MDAVDRDLINVLLRDGRASYQELARTVHLSANSTADRVRRLTRSGVISGYHAELDLAVVGRPLTALTDIKLRDEVRREDFESDLEDMPGVLEALHTTGEYDYQLRIVCAGTDDLETVIDELRRLGVREGHSRIVLGARRYSPAALLDRGRG